MENEKTILTKTDVKAIELNDSNYLNSKGANYYKEGNYAKAVEYYRIASAMGNVDSISNLGYCYLYGRDIEANFSLALAYLKIAASKKSIDASYKLGDIYGNDKWGIKDNELSIYYYRMAASYIVGDNWKDECPIAYVTRFQQFPSLCFALGRENMPDGNLYTDIDLAYQFLKHAEAGYRRELANGARIYERVYDDVLNLLQNSVFDGIREKYDSIFDGDEEEAEDYS